MNISKWITMSCAVLALGMAAGCNSDSDGDNGGGGSYAGTYTGNVCGRGLTMTVNQDGNTLTGKYTLSDPTFNENFQGTVANLNPPSSATLIAGDGRKFEITFRSYEAFDGTFYNPGPVCDVNAVK